MRRSIIQMKKEFRLYWTHYVFQSLLATLTLALVLVFLRLQNVVVVASIGATSFIVFAMPKSITAQPRNVIGGQLVGLISGSLCALIPHPAFFYSIGVYSLAVGISIFTMVVTDTEHPPASGTALGVAITGFSWNVAGAVVTAVVVLSLVHHFFKSSIRDLV
jgi:CBS-domain-containing membrane protein